MSHVVTPMAPAQLWSLLERLDLMLQRQVLRLRARHQLVDNDYRGLYIPDEHIDALLRADGRINGTTADIETLSAQINGRRTLDSPDPLQQLAEIFGLDSIECDLLLIALAPALDLRYETFYAYVQNDVAKKRPTLDLALNLLFDDPIARLGALDYADPDASLLKSGLLELIATDTAAPDVATARILHVPDRIVAYLLGDGRIEPALRPFVAHIRQPRSLAGQQMPPGVRQQMGGAAATLERGGHLFLYGHDGSGKQAAAEGVAAALGRSLLVAEAPSETMPGRAPGDWWRRLHREARLQDALIYLHLETPLEDNALEMRARLKAIDGAAVPVIVGVPGERYIADVWPERPFLEITLPVPPAGERRCLWEAALAGAPGAAEVDLENVAGKFALSGGQIREAAAYARTLAAARAIGREKLTDADLHIAARARSSQALRDLAQRVIPRYGWDDIVLPPLSREMLREVFLSVRYRQRVYQEWGFDRKLALGKGVNALFFGPSGTGKTMAADILAGALELELYKIDLSTVVSKYIGETEKNLSAIFAAAERSNAILFFDEADALFGKRSEVKDARDRYANIEVAYLLQKMEEYDGISLLATNLRGNIDDAFARRLHHTVEFPFPDVALRERIWRGVFPAETPLASDIDFPFLARQFELSGGNIRNIALSAAFRAAESVAGQVSMEAIVVGVARELTKMGKLPTRADFRHHYGLVHAA